MKLDTYQSDANPDVFVTFPSVEAPGTIAAVDKLTALRLQVVRESYTVNPGIANAAFAEFVAVEIALSGYAVHGFNLAFEKRRRPRASRKG